MNQYRNAAFRSALAVVIVAAWIIWYDGPVWAWALLLGYVAFTFGVAYFIQRQVDAKRAGRGQGE